MGRRRQVGIAHAEIDDVGAGIARGRLGAVDLLEDVRRQAADAVKLFHGFLCRLALVYIFAGCALRAFITACGPRQRPAAPEVPEA